MATNIYLELTDQFNRGRVRAIISSGQAVVLHRLAVMSKDGDWILREDDESLSHILAVLGHYNARYRYGAPLHTRWMTGGWSAHFEFRHDQLRVRTDFVTRPPRLNADARARLWKATAEWPVLDLSALAEIKKTNREKDYAVIGELARMMPDPREQLLYSRSARDLLAIAQAHPQLAEELSRQRPVLKHIGGGREGLEQALDQERRSLIRANEERLGRYQRAAERWRMSWPGIEREIKGLELGRAHSVVVAHALELLPFAP